MTIENGPTEGANDTTLPTQNTEAAENTEEEEGLEAEGEEGSEGGPSEPEDTEVDYEGKKYRVPPELKDALLRQADYTKKTMTVAEERKALEAEKASVKALADTHKAVHTEAVKVAALDERLAEYEKVDWQTLFATNPELFHQHRFAREQLKEQRDAASRALETKKGELTEHENRERGNQIAKAQAEIARHVEGWAPGNEIDLKLSAYGTSRGFTPQELGTLAIQYPKLVGEFDRLRRYDEAAQKQKQQQTFQKSQEAKPVKRVGGNSGAAARRTTDSSGDALSTEEWARREMERLAKRKA